MTEAPIWRAELAAPAPRPSPGEERRVDVAIVGGGLTGLSTALHLLDRRPGARVLLLEAERVGAGASGRSTGMVGPGIGQGLPGLVRRVGPARARSLYAATLEAVETVFALVAREAIDCDLRRTGQLVVAASAGARRRLEAEARAHEALELPCARLDEAALAARLALRRPSIALRLPTAGLVDPGRLVAGLAARVRARGGGLLEGARVRGIDGGRGGEPFGLRVATVDVSGDEGPDARIVADEVVVATAGYTPRLGLLRGRVLPVGLQVLATEPLAPEALAALGWAGREGVRDARRLFAYYRLTADDRLVFGGGAPRYGFGGAEGDPGPALARLGAELAGTFPETVRPRIAAGWGGLIAYVLDALPAIGRDPARPRLAYAVGFCGHGVALAVAAGAWLTELLADGAPREELPWHRSRPPLVPGEAVRWLAFRAAVSGMALGDRVAG